MPLVESYVLVLTLLVFGPAPPPTLVSASAFSVSVVPGIPATGGVNGEELCLRVGHAVLRDAAELAREQGFQAPDGLMSCLPVVKGVPDGAVDDDAATEPLEDDDAGPAAVETDVMMGMVGAVHGTVIAGPPGHADFHADGGCLAHATGLTPIGDGRFVTGRADSLGAVDAGYRVCPAGTIIADIGPPPPLQSQ